MQLKYFRKLKSFAEQDTELHVQKTEASETEHIWYDPAVRS